MPSLFVDLPTFVFCCLIMAGGQLIYATVGFGAGMFAVSLLALVLPDLAGTVTALFLITLVTELYVLFHAWRAARVRLLLGLLPTTVVGMWIGTQLLVAGDPADLKRVLGGVVLAAGAWFLHRELRTRGENVAPPAIGGAPPPRRTWWSLPTGLLAGVLGGLFGTGGPPVIIFLRGYGLDKGTFRATLLWYFLCMSAIRGVTYTSAGVLTMREVLAALWLLPASVVGMLTGMAVHRWLSERVFGLVVALLLMLLGLVLLVSGGR
jgi:uncharacterized membrane protein YfcA